MLDVNDDVPSLLGPMDEEGLWFFMATKLGHVDPATINPSELIRKGTGLSNLGIEIGSHIDLLRTGIRMVASSWPAMHAACIHHLVGSG